MTIEEFIEARLTEDETIAGAIPHGVWRAEVKHGAALVVDSDADTVVIVGDERENAHIARHDPARSLRQVEALRAVVGRRAGEHREQYGNCETCRDYDFHSEYRPVPWPCPTARAIAAIWSDHPDYRTDWDTRDQG
ncbi:DUF6221 family protein [Nocardia sp. No.11]|uniref:DUF6221 family protein n=1 Tax=Nocardia sp. No.11 TaxID=3128861 RepID=UPI00319DF23B